MIPPDVAAEAVGWFMGSNRTHKRLSQCGSRAP